MNANLINKNIKFLKAISDEGRIRIISLLFNRNDMCVCELQEIIGLAQPTISFNLRKLEEAEIITHIKNGTWVNYSINKNLENNFVKILKLIIDNLKDDEEIIKDHKKAEKTSRFEICKR